MYFPVIPINLSRRSADIKEEEHRFFSETASVYLQAFREALAEMNAAPVQPATSDGMSVDMRA